MDLEITVHLSDQARRALDTLTTAADQSTDEIINKAIIALLTSGKSTDWHGSDILDLDD